MIRLYDYWRSSASYRVRIALGLAGLEWESIPVDLVGGVQRSPEHLKRNPQGLVPVIEIDDLVLTQSLAILEYLNETRDMHWLPDDAAGRAKVRALAYAIGIEIHPVCNLRVASYARSMSNEGITTEAWMQHFVASGLADFEAMLEGGLYCFGDTVTLPDLCLVPQIYNANRWRVDLQPLPKTRAIFENLEQIPAFQAAHPDRASR